jgi:hypothetical protein
MSTKTSQHQEAAGHEQEPHQPEYVVVSRGEGGTRYHEPAAGLDPESDAPEPACTTQEGLHEEPNWTWRPRDGIEVWKDPCGRECEHLRHSYTEGER